MGIIEINNRFTGTDIYSGEHESMRDAILAAVKREANLSGAYLSRANLSRAYLSGAYLSGADLSRANLSGAYLSGADLSRADLSGANLSGANLSGANLSRANLSGANLSGANLSGATIGAHTLTRKVAQICRDDGYEFLGFACAGGGLLIRAGCRTMLMTEFRAHIAAEYPDTPKAAETTAILDFIEARAKATA